jgi:hypothetical protein
VSESIRLSLSQTNHIKLMSLLLKKFQLKKTLAMIKKNILPAASLNIVNTQMK